MISKIKIEQNTCVMFRSKSFEGVYEKNIPSE